MENQVQIQLVQSSYGNLLWILADELTCFTSKRVFLLIKQQFLWDCGRYEKHYRAYQCSWTFAFFVLRINCLQCRIKTYESCSPCPSDIILKHPAGVRATVSGLRPYTPYIFKVRVLIFLYLLPQSNTTKVRWCHSIIWLYLIWPDFRYTDFWRVTHRSSVNI